MSERKAEPATSVERDDERPLPPARGPEQPPGEIDGPKGPEPTRCGEGEKGGRGSDF